jgi:hypothetical protein
MKSSEILEQWHTGVRILHHAHTRAAVSFDRRGRFLGVPVVIASTAVGTSIFTGLGGSHALQIAAGLVSFGAAVLSSLQTALKYPELATQHKSAAQKYGQLRRKIETRMVADSEDPSKATASLDDFRQEWDALDEQSPNIPQWIYQKATEAVSAGRSNVTHSADVASPHSAEY